MKETTNLRQMYCPRCMKLLTEKGRGYFETY